MLKTSNTPELSSGYVIMRKHRQAVTTVNNIFWKWPMKIHDMFGHEIRLPCLKAFRVIQQACFPLKFFAYNHGRILYQCIPHIFIRFSFRETENCFCCSRKKGYTYACHLPIFWIFYGLVITCWLGLLYLSFLFNVLIKIWSRASQDFHLQTSCTSQK